MGAGTNVTETDDCAARFGILLGKTGRGGILRLNRNALFGDGISARVKHEGADGLRAVVNGEKVFGHV